MMLKPLRRDWLLALLTVSVVALAAALYVHRDRLSRYSAWLETAQPLVDRTLTSDRLIGATLPPLNLPVVQGDSLSDPSPGGPPRVLWFLEIDKCSACLDRRLRHWHALTRGSGLEAGVVMSGVSRERARALARRADLRGTVLVDQDASVARRLGFRAPSVSLVQEASGVVLMADARFEGTQRSCGWSFFRQVEALLADGVTDRIRSAGAPST